MYNVITNKGNIIASYDNVKDAEYTEGFYNQYGNYSFVKVEEAKVLPFRKPTPQEETIMQHYLKLKENAKNGKPWWNLS